MFRKTKKIRLMTTLMLGAAMLSPVTKAWGMNEEEKNVKKASPHKVKQGEHVSNDVVTYRIAGDNPHATFKRSAISFKLLNKDIQQDAVCELIVNHRTKETGPLVKLFDPGDRRYINLQRLPQSLEFIDTKLDLKNWNIGKMLGGARGPQGALAKETSYISFEDGKSDIHSFTLKSNGNIIKQVILGDPASELQPGVHIYAPEKELEEIKANQWSTPQKTAPFLPAVVAQLIEENTEQSDPQTFIGPSSTVFLQSTLDLNKLRSIQEKLTLSDNDFSSRATAIHQNAGTFFTPSTFKHSRDIIIKAAFKLTPEEIFSHAAVIAQNTEILLAPEGGRGRARTIKIAFSLTPQQISSRVIAIRENMENLFFTPNMHIAAHSMIINAALKLNADNILLRASAIRKNEHNLFKPNMSDIDHARIISAALKLTPEEISSHAAAITQNEETLFAEGMANKYRARIIEAALEITLERLSSRTKMIAEKAETLFTPNMKDEERFQIIISYLN